MAPLRREDVKNPLLLLGGGEARIGFGGGNKSENTNHPALADSSAAPPELRRGANQKIPSILGGDEARKGFGGGKSHAVQYCRGQK